MFIVAVLTVAVVGLAQAQQVYYIPAEAAPTQQRTPVYETAAIPSPIYAYIPPSPLAPPCPTGYTCCGVYKYYDPQSIKRCCGDYAYTPSLQSCANGQVVSIVQAKPPPPTTPLPVYVQRVELTCEGVSWRVPYPNYACCGPSVFNIQRETCIDGIVNGLGSRRVLQQQVQVPRQPEQAPVVDEEVETTTPMPSTRVLTCQGRRYAVPSVDFQFYACCGYEAYFWIREQCINGQISPPRPATTTTSKTPIPVPMLVVCDTTQHWVASDERQFYGCCGSDLYDMRVETCRAPLRPSGAGSSSSAGGSQCAAGFLCCESYPAVENTAGNLRCCPGIGPFDPTVSNCPSDSKK